MEAGLATEAAYNDLNLVKDLHHFQEINGAIGKTTLTTFSRHLWYLGADLVGLSLFSERISMEEKKKIAEETRKEKDLDRIRFNKAADQLINSSLPSLTSSASVRALKPPSTSTSPSFPSLWTSGSKPCVPEGGVHSEEPQRHKRRGRAWGGDDFIVSTTP
ncbi:hypothetical protein GWK47_031378 [Chionoecetes opilio]|uniref:Uncharacterized protein n=1 Tax=Chionoecetes opilio TaxID=41210 RepID=A0A8J4YV47_CHIOP|nr:hypothetical protein GWK47_031378 [Chionoecetes opilio]